MYITSWHYSFLSSVGARTIDVSWKECEEHINMDYTYLLYLQYTGASLSSGNVCRYTVTSNKDDKKICILVLKFYADVAHAQSTKVEYHEHRFAVVADEVRY